MKETLPARSLDSLTDDSHAENTLRRLVPSEFNWATICLAIWAAGDLFQLVRHHVTYRRFIATLSAAPCDLDEWNQERAEVPKNSKVRSGPSLLVTAIDIGPLTFWYQRRHCIVVPFRHWSRLSSLQRRAALSHETKVSPAQKKGCQGRMQGIQYGNADACFRTNIPRKNTPITGTFGSGTSCDARRLFSYCPS